MPSVLTNQPPDNMMLDDENKLDDDGNDDDYNNYGDNDGNSDNQKLSHNEPAFSRIFFSVLFCENSVTLSRYSCFVRLSFLSPNGFILRNNSCAAFLALFSSSGVFMHQVTSSKLLSSTPEFTSGRKSIYKGLQGLHRP